MELDNPPTLDAMGLQKLMDKLASITDNYPTYRDKIMQLMNDFPARLKEYTDSYLLWKRYPENTVYKEPFLSAVQNLNAVNDHIDQASKTVQDDTASIQHTVDIIGKTLSWEKKEGHVLEKREQNTHKDITGSHEMIYDFVDDYKRVRLALVLLMVGVIFLSVYLLYQFVMGVRPQDGFGALFGIKKKIEDAGKKLSETVSKGVPKALPKVVEGIPKAVEEIPRNIQKAIQLPARPTK